MEVMRDRFRDIASPFNRRKRDLFRAWWCLKCRKQVQTGRNNSVRAGFDLKMCNTAWVRIGSNCIFNEHVFICLTKPDPRLVIG